MRLILPPEEERRNREQDATIDLIVRLAVLGACAIVIMSFLGMF